MLKAVRVRIYPNIEQQKYLEGAFGCSRLVYNQCLTLNNNIYEYYKELNQFHIDNNIDIEQLKTYISKFDYCFYLSKNLRSLYPFLYNHHTGFYEQTIVDLIQAFDNYFKNSSHFGHPIIKTKHKSKKSIRLMSKYVSSKLNFMNNKLDLIKPLSNILFRCSERDKYYLQKNIDNISSFTISKSKTNKYYVSILVDGNLKYLKDNNLSNFDDDNAWIVKELPKTDNIIGIDYGIKDFITTSDGVKYDNIKSIRKNEDKLNRLQKRLSRKKKGSKNREKARLKLAKYHEKIHNQKLNYIHHITNELLNENQVIVIEDLNIKGMMKNHKLAKAIQELSIAETNRILEYKANWYNKQIVKVDTFFPSSKLCSSCNHKNIELELKDRIWICSSCNIIHDRDLNASINLKNEGLRILTTLKDIKNISKTNNKS